MTMKAAYILVGVLVVVLVALAVIYAQATAQLQQLFEELKKTKEESEALKRQISDLEKTAEQLKTALAQREEEIKKLQHALAHREEEMKKLEQQLQQAQAARRSLVYAAVREGKTLYIYVIDPATNQLIAKVDLNSTVGPEVRKELTVAVLGLETPSMFEDSPPRYFLPDLPYLIVMFETPRGAYVALVDRYTFKEFKVIKTHDKYTRQYGGITPDGRYLIIGLRQAQRVVIIDLQKFEIVKTVEVDANPCDAAPSPDGKYVLLPLRSDKDPNKPEYALVLEVPTGREVARYYLKRPGEETYTEPAKNYWSYYKPNYGMVRSDTRPYEALLEIDVKTGTMKLIKEVSYPAIAYMAVENPVREEVVVTVTGFGVYVRSLPPEYRVLKEVKLVPDYMNRVQQGTYSPDGRYFYLAGSGGLVVLDTSTWTVVKHFKADFAFWVLSVPSGEWLKLYGK
jgi:DNA-binding beta-propeller fold protein YncE